MKIVIVGAGNLATHIGKALFCAGNEISQIYSRTLESAALLASCLDSSPVADIGNIVDDADLYVVSVSDKALEEIVPQLCKGRDHAIFVHTAGSMPMSVFRNHATHFGVIYPMQTFSKNRKLIFSDIPCFIEASDDSTLCVLHRVCAGISSKVVELSSEDRKYLHLAAVFASNFVNHCYNISSVILRSHGLGFDVMYPLIDEVASKVHEMSPVDAQTGPAVRYDQNVLARQLELLAGQPEFRDVYEIMSRGIYEIRKRND